MRKIAGKVIEIIWQNADKFVLFQVNVCLECINTSLKALKRRFIRCSAQATITHLKKFIAKKVLNGMEKYRDVSKKRIYEIHLK